MPSGEVAARQRRPAGGPSGGREKYTLRMILSFGSGDGTAAWALAPAWLALVAYAGAALLPPRADLWVRAALVLAWLAHAAAIVIDTTGIGLPTPGARFGFAPALSTTLWLVI